MTPLLLFAALLTVCAAAPPTGTFNYTADQIAAQAEVSVELKALEIEVALDEANISEIGVEVDIEVSLQEAKIISQLEALGAAASVQLAQGQNPDVVLPEEFEALISIIDEGNHVIISEIDAGDAQAETIAATEAAEVENFAVTAAIQQLRIIRDGLGAPLAVATAAVATAETNFVLFNQTCSVFNSIVEVCSQGELQIQSLNDSSFSGPSQDVANSLQAICRNTAAFIGSAPVNSLLESSFPTGCQEFINDCNFGGVVGPDQSGEIAFLEGVSQQASGCLTSCGPNSTAEGPLYVALDQAQAELSSAQSLFDVAEANYVVGSTGNYNQVNAALQAAIVNTSVAQSTLNTGSTAYIAAQSALSTATSAWDAYNASLLVPLTTVSAAAASLDAAQTANAAAAAAAVAANVAVAAAANDATTANETLSLAVASLAATTALAAQVKRLNATLIAGSAELEALNATVVAALAALTFNDTEAANATYEAALAAYNAALNTTGYTITLAVQELQELNYSIAFVPGGIEVVGPPVDVNAAQAAVTTANAAVAAAQIAVTSAQAADAVALTQAQKAAASLTTAEATYQSALSAYESLQSSGSSLQAALTQAQANFAQAQASFNAAFVIYNRAIATQTFLQTILGGLPKTTGPAF